MLLPALCKATSQSKVDHCLSNFRQWAVSANLYARDSLPGFAATTGGMNPWGVGTKMIPSLGPYGLTELMWFCPARTAEMSAQFAAAQSAIPS